MVTFEELEAAAVRLGARLVWELGGFLPFAVIANRRGELEQFGADVGTPDPTPSEVYEFLMGALAAHASQEHFTAVAVVLHQQPPPELGIPEDKSIHAYIDIVGHGARSVFLPYSEDEDGNLKVGTAVTVEKETHFFTAETS
jgi:hypothetical protein